MTFLKRSDITLHETIKRIINEYGPAVVSEITAKVNEQGLYKRKDGEPVTVNQICARIRKYPHMFIKEGGKVYLNVKNRIISIEAAVGGYFGGSYNVFIDLEIKDNRAIFAGVVI